MSRHEVICDDCQKQILTEDSSIFGSFVVGDLVVHYFRCPHCGRKYHVLTTNTELRQLITKRKGVEQQLQLAHQKHFKAKTIKSLIYNLDVLKAEEVELADGLKVLGMNLLGR